MAILSANLVELHSLTETHFQSTPERARAQPFRTSLYIGSGSIDLEFRTGPDGSCRVGQSRVNPWWAVAIRVQRHGTVLVCYKSTERPTAHQKCGLLVPPYLYSAT